MPDFVPSTSNPRRRLESQSPAAGRRAELARGRKGVETRNIKNLIPFRDSNDFLSNPLVRDKTAASQRSRSDT